MKAGLEVTKYPAHVSEEVAFPAARIGISGARPRGSRAIAAASNVTSTM